VEEYRSVIILSAAAIALIVAVGILVAIGRRRRQARMLAAPLPLIPFTAGRSAAAPARPDNVATPPRNVANAAPAYDTTPDWNPPVEHARPPEPPRSSYAPPSPMSPVQPTSANALSGTAQPNEPIEGSAVDGALVRYWRPADGTLQFLPGRLEVIAGRDAGQEIRFVRTPGPDGSRVTFGRAEGAPYRHVQLREPTVSRAHARMTLENGARPGAAAAQNGAGAHVNGARWRLENLSATNPVVVNGRPLAADGTDDCWVSLGEGDRIEMGEVVFRFHEK